MDNNFEIPITYRQKEVQIPATLQVTGYTYRIETLIEGVVFHFERDDSGDFRAILAPDTPPTAKMPDTLLIQSVAEALTELFP